MSHQQKEEFFDENHPDILTDDDCDMKIDDEDNNSCDSLSHEKDGNISAMSDQSIEQRESTSGISNIKSSILSSPKTSPTLCRKETTVTQLITTENIVRTRKENSTFKTQPLSQYRLNEMDREPDDGRHEQEMKRDGLTRGSIHTTTSRHEETEQFMCNRQSPQENATLIQRKPATTTLPTFKNTGRPSLISERKMSKPGTFPQNKPNLNKLSFLSDFRLICILVLGIFGILFILVIIVKNLKQVEENPSDLQFDDDLVQKNFLRMFDDTRHNFPSQTNNFWKVLRSGTKSIMVSKTPNQPAVFILAAPRGAEVTAICIARKYAKAVTDAFNGSEPLEFRSHLHTMESARAIKENIDNSLNNAFLGGSHVAIIHELNRLHGESVMMFHGYCDNDNAPFTKVVFLFILHLESSDVEEINDALVEKKLAQIWSKHLNDDKMIPLMSRIGNSNAFVKQETEDVLIRNKCI